MSRKNKAGFACGLPWVMALMLLFGCSTVPRSFQPLHPISPSDFSYKGFDEVLRDHVKDGAVDYPAVGMDQRFQFHIRQLDRIDPTQLPTRRDRLAFWINAYNAFAMKGIVDGYSPKTVVGRYRYFISRDYDVGGKPINLYDLERKLLIPDYQEPRVHFAIVCASQSCPKLRSEVYTADKLDEQLEESARAFINDPTKNQFDRNGKVAYLSMIFKWFDQDFIAQAGSLLNYVKRYVADPTLAEDLEMRPYQVEFLEYDWNLNGAPYAGSRP
jgi:hypothetical protein